MNSKRLVQCDSMRHGGAFSIRRHNPYLPKILQSIGQGLKTGGHHPIVIRHQNTNRRHRQLGPFTSRNERTIRYEAATAR